MDGENNGKPYENSWFGVFSPYFWKQQITFQIRVIPHFHDYGSRNAGSPNQLSNGNQTLERHSIIYTGWLIWILRMAYYNPYITG